MNVEKLVAVTTFCSWTSYGSMLQAYALKQTLSKIGYKSYILIDRVVATPESKCRIPRTLKPTALLRGWLNHQLLADVTKQYQKSNQFLRENVDIIYYNGYQELALNYLKADYYLAGSDQIFNPNNPQPGFYFEYVPDKSRLLTYACSMGTTNVPPEHEEVFAKRLSNFHRISVRESDNIPVLQKYRPDAEYQTHIDPTFLLDADEWRKKEKPYPVDGKYILLYPLYWDKSLNQYVKKLKSESGLKIIGVFSSGYNTIECDKKLYDVGVDEFLWLVDHAEGVITSSFHGAAFSTIFGKKLCLVTNPRMPSRLNNLAQKFNIPKCSIEDVLSNHWDYAGAARVIQAEQKRSRRYLEEILNAE